MQIWIDADACPVAVRDVAIRAALRLRIPIFFVANKHLTLPPSEFINFIAVKAGADVADNYIHDNAQVADLVVTQDIPLAHGLVSKGIVVINPRGEVYTEHNIGSKLSMRNLFQELRDSGEISGGPKQFGEKEKRAFAASFDRELSKLLNRK